MSLAADKYINGPQFAGGKLGYYPYWWENTVTRTGDTTLGAPIVSGVNKDGNTFKSSVRWCKYVVELAKSKAT